MAGRGGKRSTSFKPGNCANPSGRPKVPEHVRELARAYTDEAINTLGTIMKDAKAPAPARVTAANTLLDRAWGKAESTTTIKLPGHVRELSTAEILASLAAAGAIGEETGGGEPDSVH